MDAAGDTPVMAYAFPDRAGYPLPPEVLDTLAGEALAGLKLECRPSALRSTSRWRAGMRSCVRSWAPSA